jgi:hypothetical protein
MMGTLAVLVDGTEHGSPWAGPEGDAAFTGAASRTPARWRLVQAAGGLDGSDRIGAIKVLQNEPLQVAHPAGRHRTPGPMTMPLIDLDSEGES